MITREARAHGAVATVSVPASVQQGKDVRFSVTLHNEGREDPIYGDMGVLPLCHAVLMDTTTGKQCPLTAFGRNFLLKGRREMGFYTESAVPRDRSKTWSANLNDFYQLAVGTYELALTIEMNPSGGKTSFEITVDKVRFRVVP